MQAAHFDRLAAAYAAHYNDPCSQRFRKRFVADPMFEGTEPSGCSAVELMCGSGQTTPYLLSRGLTVTGLDLSPGQIAIFRGQFPQCEAVCASVTDSHLPSASFDYAVVVGGLHHVHPHVREALDEICRILKPGGYLCFVEPHKGSLPDLARQVWYRHDSMFQSNEAALDLPELKRAFQSRFEFELERYSGNLAYLFVYNSLIFRIPLWIKPYYTPLLMGLEPLLAKFQPRCLSCYVVGRWRKRFPACEDTDSKRGSSTH